MTVSAIKQVKAPTPSRNTMQFSDSKVYIRLTIVNIKISQFLKIILHWQF